MATEKSTPIRVFIIHGQRSILWGLERLIGSRQRAMQLAGSTTSCAEALKHLDEAAPDVILFDLDVGLGDSIAAIAELRARSHAKILVLTGSRNHSLLDDAVLAGASGVVRKESPAETILAAIDKAHEGQLWLDRVTTHRILRGISQALSQTARASEQPKMASLTEREREIVALAADHPRANGRTLAQMLNINEKTLRNHLSSIYGKLNVSTRLAMHSYAYKHGLTSAPSTSQSISPRKSSPGQSR